MLDIVAMKENKIVYIKCACGILARNLVTM